MDVVAYLPADAQAAEPVQVGEGAFHDPALGAQTGAVFGAAAGDQWLHAEVSDQAAVLVVVVTTVREDHVRAAPGPTALAPHRRYRLKQRDQLGDVVAVAASQGGGERDPGGVGDQVVIAAGSAPVDRTSSGLGPPLTRGCGSRRRPPGRSPWRSRCGAWRGGPRAAGTTRRPRSTRPGAASRSCPTRSRVPAAGVPRRSRCAARTGSPGTPAGPDAACARGAGSGARPWVTAARSLPTARRRLPTASDEPPRTPRSSVPE